MHTIDVSIEDGSDKREIYLSNRSGILENSKCQYIKLIIKIIIAFILCFVLIPLLIQLLELMLIKVLGTSLLPDDDLQRAIAFMEEGQYIGMTLEECEEIFGDSGLESPGQCVVYPAGNFQWGLSDGYELYIYFDDDERVKAVKLKEEKDI